MIDSSPRRTLISRGSSAMPVWLRIRPTRVSCGSLRLLSARASSTRNLRTWIGLFFSPYRLSRTKIGPGASSLIAIEAIRRSGENRMRPIAAAAISSSRFAIFSTPRVPLGSAAELPRPISLSSCNATTPPTLLYAPSLKTDHFEGLNEVTEITKMLPRNARCVCPISPARGKGRSSLGQPIDIVASPASTLVAVSGAGDQSAHTTF